MLRYGRDPRCEPTGASQFGHREANGTFGRSIWLEAIDLRLVAWENCCGAALPITSASGMAGPDQSDRLDIKGVERITFSGGRDTGVDFKSRWSPKGTKTYNW